MKEKSERKPPVLINPYEEVRKAGLKSVKEKVKLSTFGYREREEDTSFWPVAPKDFCETHELARKAHVYGSSLK